MAGPSSLEIGRTRVNYHHSDGIRTLSWAAAAAALAKSIEQTGPKILNKLYCVCLALT
jgi:hypothetical protein